MASNEAAFLRALADHLDTHQLPDVLIHWRIWAKMSVELQLTGSDDTIPDLIAWAASLDTTEVKLRNIEDRLYLHVYGRIGERDVEVWTTTQRKLGPIDRRTITVAELVNPMPKRRTKPMGGARNTVPLEPPPTPLRVVDGVWRPNAPGFADRPGEKDTRPLPQHTRKARR